MDADSVVRDYLGRLEAAAWPLSAERRGELLVEVQEHIESALAEAGRRDEVTARNVLERLGGPEEIVAAEASETGPAGTWKLPAASAERPPRWGPVEVTGILFLTLGAVFLPIIGPLIGLVFIWMSSVWTSRQKGVATAIVVVLMFLPILMLLGASVGSGSYGS